MKRQVILDIEPLVAFLNGRDRYHEWAMLQWAQIYPPLLTCEALLHLSVASIDPEPLGGISRHGPQPFDPLFR